MSPSDLAAELARPLTDTTILVGMLVFMGLGLLAQAAGLFGLWLGVVVLPAFCKHLVEVMQSRIDGRKVEPAGIELFNPLERIWTLFPMVLALLGVLTVALAREVLGMPGAGLAGAVLLTAMPASCGVLGLTGSPAAALNPALLLELARRCWPAYAAIPAASALAGAGIVLLVVIDAPAFLVQLSEVYALFLWFSLTGAVVQSSGARGEVGSADPPEPDEAARLVQTDRARATALNHAYGLFSRGNRLGGLKHIDDFIGRYADEAAKIDEFDWFFRQMMDWELSAPGLLVGQRYLTELLDAGDNRRAIKVLTRCLLVEPGFQPLPDDRERVLSLLESAGRDDLINQLR